MNRLNSGNGKTVDTPMNRGAAQIAMTQVFREPQYFGGMESTIGSETQDASQDGCPGHFSLFCLFHNGPSCGISAFSVLSGLLQSSNLLLEQAFNLYLLGRTRKASFDGVAVEPG
jgi:hypothetical protein